LTITTQSLLAPGTLSAQYSTTLMAGGGTPPYSSWRVVAGSLPPGLSLNSATGTLSTYSSPGLPSSTNTLRMAGTYQFAVQVSDSANQSSPSATFSLAVSPPPLITTLQAFQDCIGSTGGVMGYGSSCSVGPNSLTDSGQDPSRPYDSSNPYYPVVANSLVIGRSDITIGAATSNVVLRRASSWAPGASGNSIMKIAQNAPVSGVIIESFIIDGNRYGFKAGQDISCVTGSVTGGVTVSQLDNPDLDLKYGSAITVEFLDFVNAPDTAVWMPGNSLLFGSVFGQGANGIGPSGLYGPEPPGQTATRFTAAYISGAGSKANWNTISYAGTAGLTLDGTGQTAEYNTLTQNRYEISDGVGGGQLTVWPSVFTGGPSTTATIAANAINGQLWSRPAGTGPNPSTGCPAVPDPKNQYVAQAPSGMELNGYGHSFYNNEVEQNTGGGMSLNLGDPTGQILFSGNPHDSSDTTVRYVENNGYHGIDLHGPPRGGCPPGDTGCISNNVEGVTLDALLVRNNAGCGVVLQDVLDYCPGCPSSVNYYGLAPRVAGTFLGFQNGSCMSGNSPGGVCTQTGAQVDGTGNAAWYSNQSSPQPTNYAPNTYSSVNGIGACPGTVWPSQPAPAASHPVGWPW